MKRMHLKIVTPKGVFLDQEVDGVYVPGVLGELGALPGHTPCLVELAPGVLRCEDGSDSAWFAIAGGVAELGHQQTIVLAETCERAAEIDPERAESARERANARLGDFSKQADHDVERAQTALARATARLVASKRR